MGILNKIFTALKGHATEAGQAVVDANALTILDQEIRDADNELRKSKDNLAAIMAKQKVAEDKLRDKRAKLAEYGGYIEQAMSKGDEALAREVATKFADLESEVATEQDVVDQYANSVSSLRRTIAQTETHLKQMKTKVDTVKAKEHVLRASAAVAAAHSGTNSKMRSALDSFERLQAGQAERMARIDAANQMAKEADGGDLEAKLRAAGLKSGGASADDVMARFRKTQAPS